MPTKILRLALLPVCLALLAPLFTGRAEELRPEPRFQVLPSTTYIPERGAVTSYALLTETTRFNFIPPANATLEVDARARRIRLSPGDHKSVITFLVTTNDPALLKEPGQAALHDLVQQRYTNAVGQAMGCYTGSGPGCSFDVEQVTTNKARITTRIAFVPFPDGLAEISLITPSTNFHNEYFRFASVLGSLLITPAPANGLKRPAPARSQEISR